MRTMVWVFPVVDLLECNSTIPTIVSQSINSFVHIYNNSRYEEEKNKMRSNPMTDFESKKSNYLQFSNKGDNLAFQVCFAIKKVMN